MFTASIIISIVAGIAFVSWVFVYIRITLATTRYQRETSLQIALLNNNLEHYISRIDEKICSIEKKVDNHEKRIQSLEQTNERNWGMSLGNKSI